MHRSRFPLALLSCLGLMLSACNSPESVALNDAAKALKSAPTAAQAPTIAATAPTASPAETTLPHARLPPHLIQTGLMGAIPVQFSLSADKPFSRRISR
jgi:hypothetical protein